MAAIKFETRVDETKAGAFPELRPFLGQEVVLVAVAANDQSAGEVSRRDRISFDDFLRDHQIERPDGIEPVSLEDMDRAIVRGALGGGL